MSTKNGPPNLRVRGLTRLRLALRAWHARWTGAEEGRVWRRDYHGEFDKYFAENAYDFGEYVAHKAIDGDLRRALQNLVGNADSEPMLLLRRAFPKPWLPIGFSAEFSPLGRHRASPTGARALQPHNARAYIRKGRFDIVAAAIVAATGAELRKKNATDHKVRQDYLTDCESETCTFHEGRDLWQRFRQATPEFSPDDVRADKVAASVVLIGCVENTIRDPVYVLPVANVLCELDHDTLNELRKKQFEFVDGWASDLSEVNRHHKSIVGGEGDDPKRWWLSFDANRIATRSDKTSEAGLRAVGKLLQQIDRVGRDANPILLRRGDALVVNNYRAMIRRKERSRFVFTWPWPDIRWLRVYYGFPRDKDREHDDSRADPH